MPDLPAVRLATHSQRQRDGLPLVIADRYSGAALNISNRYAGSTRSASRSQPSCANMIDCKRTWLLFAFRMSSPRNYEAVLVL